ncbi:MAG: hypothetical protein Q9157_004155 [Trypethelium eluteriae]
MVMSFTVLLPPVLQNYILPSSAASSRDSESSPTIRPTFEGSSYDSIQLPSFAEITGFRDTTGSPLGFDQSQPSLSWSDLLDPGSESDYLGMAPRKAPKRAAEASSSSPNKRMRKDSVPGLQRNADRSIEELDLVEEDTALADTLKKQRQQQVALQEDSRKPTKLSKISCIICMETPTNLTATSCGHLFCYECLMQALNFSARNGGDGRRGMCPVCRKVVSRVKKDDIIPLEIMKKGLATQPKRSSSSGT